MMLKLIVVTFLILTSKIRTSPLIEYSSDDESCYESQNPSSASASVISNDSPVSVAFISDSPDLLTGHKLINPTKPRLLLEALGRDLILTIGEYLEFPHSTLGQLNREFNKIFENISPSQIIANQLKFPELKMLPKSFDLKYLITLKGSALNDERLLAVIVDVAFLKRLPNIKVALLRLFYSRLRTLKTIGNVGEDLLFKFIHPFQHFKHSTMSSLFVAFFEADDFDLIFDILETYPRIILRNSEIIFTYKFIESAGKMDKLASIYEIFSRNGLVSMQNKFDFVCRCLGITLNQVILDSFLFEAFRPHETWRENYSLTFLDAWIFALTYSADNFLLGDGEKFSTELKQKIVGIRDWSIQVTVRKQTLLLLLAIQSDQQNYRQKLENFVSNFALDPFTKRFYEEILWALVIKKQYENFFYLLREFSVIDSPKLRLAIAKSNCNEFIAEIIDKFNVRMLFSTGFPHYEAIYNKNLLLTLTGHEDELNYLYDSVMDENVFRYAVEHFKTLEDWDRFFTIHDFWKGLQFSQFLQFLLNNHRRVEVFEFILTLLHEKNLRFDLWGRPVIHLSIESAEFLLQSPILRDLLVHLSYSLRFGFECSPMVMAHLITANICTDERVIRLINFNTNDILLLLPHWKDHERYKRLFGLCHSSHVDQLKIAITDLIEINQNITDQESFDSCVMTIFNPILSKLKQESPVDYLILLPTNILKWTISNDPIYMKEVIDWAVANMRIHSLFNALRDNVVRVKGPIDLQRLEKFLFTHKVRLIIE